MPPVVQVASRYKPISPPPTTPGSPTNPIIGRAVDPNIERSPFAPGTPNNPIIGSAVNPEIEKRPTGVEADNLFYNHLNSLPGPKVGPPPAPVQSTGNTVAPPPTNTVGPSIPTNNAPSAPGTVAPPPTRDNSQLTDTIRNNYMRDLDDKTKAINDALAQAIQAGELAVGQNKQMLDERIKELTQEKNVNDQQIVNLQNRRGGFYSGGTDYQLGQNATDFNTNSTNVKRDIDQRNADIYGRNSLLAKQAGESIQQLKNAAPDRIREILRQAINDEKQFGLQEGTLTGQYNGQATAAQRNAERSLGLQEGALTGYFNGNPTLAAQQFDWAKQVDTAGMTGQFNGQQTIQGQNQSFQQGVQAAGLTGQYNGAPTLAAQQFGEQQKQNNLGNMWAGVDRYGYTNGPVSSGQALGDMYKGATSLPTQQFQQGQRQDTIRNNQWQQTFDYTKQLDGAKLQTQAQQFAQSMNMDWAKLSMEEQQFMSDLSMRQQVMSDTNLQNQFSQGMEAYKTSGQMPDYMKNFGINVDGVNNAATKEKVSNLLNMLVDGKQDPAQLLKVIDLEEKSGVSNTEEANQLRNTIYQYDPALAPKAAGTGGNSGLANFAAIPLKIIANTAQIGGAFVRGVGFLAGK